MREAKVAAKSHAKAAVAPDDDDVEVNHSAFSKQQQQQPSFSITLNDTVSMSSSPPGTQQGLHAGSRAGPKTHTAAASASPSSAATKTSSSTGPFAHTELSSLIGRRFGAIVREAVERVELLGYLLTGDAAIDPSQNGSLNLVALLDRNHDLEAKFRMLLDSQAQTRRDDAAGGVQSASHNKDARAVAKALKRSVYDIQDLLQCVEQGKHVLTPEEYSRIQLVRASLEFSLGQCAGQLNEDHYTALRRQIDSYTQTRQTSEQKKAKKAQLQTDIARTEQEIEIEHHAFETEIKKRDQVLASMSEDVRHARRQSDVTLTYDRERAEAELQAKMRVRKQELTNLEKQVAAIQRALQADAMVNADTMAYLARRKSENEKIAQAWEAKYNKEYQAICSELENLKALQQRDAVALQQLQDRWDSEEAAAARERADRQRQKEHEIAANKLLRIVSLAQCKIRLAWRLYKRRKAKAAAGKRKGKKGSSAASPKSAAGAGSPKSAATAAKGR